MPFSRDIARRMHPDFWLPRHKPVGPVSPSAIAHTLGLTCGYLLRDSGSQLHDVCRRFTATLEGGTLVPEGIQFSVSGDRFYVAKECVNASQGAVLMAYRRIGSVPNLGTFFNVERPTNDSPAEMLLMNFTSGTVGLRFLPNADQSNGTYWNFGSTADALFVEGQLYILALTWDQAAGVLAGYIDGAKTGSQTGSSWTLNSWTGTERAYFGGNPATGDYDCNGILESVFVFSQALQESVVASLSEALYLSLLEPATNYFWMPSQVAGGGVSYTIGQAVETEIAFSLSWSKAYTVGQAVETESAQPLSIERSYTLGQAVEQELAQPLDWSKAFTVGQAVEVESAFPVTPERSHTIGQAVENESAQPLTWEKAFTVGQAVETEIAFKVYSQEPPTGGRGKLDDDSYAR